jgi:tetratricopeptide (TPR) repeat protein
MAPAGFRVCPACGSRNKPKWEACVRCGELLSGVAVAPGAPRRATQRDAPIGPGPVVTPLGLLALAVTAVFFFQFRGLQPTVPPADSFTIPTRPPAPAAAREDAPLPAASSSSFAQGRLALLRGDMAEAVRLLAAAVAESPREALYHHFYARALWQSGEREQALREHDLAVQLSPSSVDYRTERASALLALERRDEAAREYESVLRDEPGNVLALRALAGLQLEQGDRAASAALLEKAVQLRKGDPEVVQELAYALERAGNYEQAGAYYAAIVDRQPDAQIPRSRLAETLLARKQPDEAVRVLQEGIARTPTAPLLRRSLGSVFERTGKVQEAIAAYREYVRLAPNAEDARTLEARASGLERRLRAESARANAAEAPAGS